MKWFKHYTDAHEGQTLQRLYRKFGLEGEARYWRLVEFLAKQYGNNDTIFYVSLETIRGLLRLRSLNDCRLFLDHLATISDLLVEYNGNDCQISYPKLSEIRDNHTKNLPVTCKLVSENLPLDKTRLDKTRREKKAGPATALATQGAINSDEWIIIEYFNATLKRNLKQTKSNYGQIKARLAEGYTIDQMKILLDHVNAVWTIDPFWVKQIKPATIFSGKFDGYLQEALNKPKSMGDSLEEFFREAGCIA